MKEINEKFRLLPLRAARINELKGDSIYDINFTRQGEFRQFQCDKMRQVIIFGALMPVTIVRQ